jgi:hypothetical protein
MSVSATAMNLAGFENYVSGLLPGIKRQYDRGVNRDLSQQHWQELLKRNVTTLLQQVYRDALIQLKELTIDCEHTAEADSDLRKRVLTPFNTLIEELIQYAVQKHRSSCALSNFPDEHNPSQAYIAQVLQEVDRDWSVFVSQVAGLLPR